MKRLHAKWLLPLLAAACAVTGCDTAGVQEDDDTSQERPFRATSRIGGNDTRATVDSDALTFKWENKSEEAHLVYKDGEQTGYTFTIDQNTISDDGRQADFGAESGFEAEAGTWLLAAIPTTGYTAAEGGSYTFTMPEEDVVQTGNNSTEHIGLRMPMYARAQATAERTASFSFKHLGSLLRFRVKNLNSGAETITGIGVEAENGASVFGRSVTLTADGASVTATYADEGNSRIGVTLSSCTVAAGEILTAYTAMLPGASFGEGTVLKVVLTTGGGSYVSDRFTITDGSGLSLTDGKWTPGKFYTLNLTLDNELRFEGVSHDGFTETDNDIEWEGLAEN